MNKWIFTVILSCIFSVFLSAQNRTIKCLEFENLEVDEMYKEATGYAEGDIFFEEDGITATLQSFLYPDGTSDIFGITILDNPFNLQRPDFSRGLFISNANAQFDFSGFAEDVVRVAINFADGGGEENLSINGEDIQIVSMLNELNGTTIGGVEVIVHLDSTVQGIEHGILVLEGEIKSLSIGGQEFFIDNVCVRTREGESCSIRELTVRPLECFDTGRYTAEINFFHRGVDNESFDIFLNGELVGTKNLADLPIEHEFFYSPNQTDNILTVCINDRPDCCARVRFEQPDCEGNDCVIEVFEVYPTECDSNGQSMVNLFVAAQNGSREGFYITDVFQERFGPFSYADSLVILGPYSDLDDVPLTFNAYDATNENCRRQTELFDICNNGFCWIEDVFFEPHPCDDNGQFLLDIDVTARNGSTDGFFVEYLGERFGPFSYEDPFITVGPLSPGSDVPIEVRVFDSESENCEYSEIINPPCEINCDLQVRAATTACTPNDIFFVDLFVTGGTDTYMVRAGGQRWGPFAYVDSLVRIGPFRGSNEGNFPIGIQDQAFPHCQEVLVLENPCGIQSCGLRNLRTESTRCRPDSTFDLVINFEATNDLVDSFEVRYQDRLIAFFTAADLPFKIENFPYLEERFVEICVSGSRRCCSLVRFEVPDGCSNDVCSFENVIVAPQRCDADGQFYVHVEVQANNPIGDGYFIRVLDEVFGPFSYTDSIVQIGPFDGTIEIAYGLTIYDAANDACFYEQRFRSPCFDDACTIQDVLILPQRCNEEGFFFVELAVWANFIQNGGYVVDVFGERFGPFRYLDSIVQIGPFDGNVDVVYEIIIYDLENDDCFYAGEFVSPCTASECEIRNLQVETTECIDSGSVNLVIDFEVQGAENEFFDLYYRSELIGFFPLNELPITIEDFHFDERPNTPHQIRVCINDSRDCCAAVNIYNPCPPSDCHITGVVAEPLLCENNEFKVDLFVKTNQPNQTGYFVQINNRQIFGPFSYEQEFITIGPFEGDGRTIYQVNVIDGENRSCRNGTRFQAVNCSESCNINELRLEVGEICREDGTFPLTVDFDIQNPIGMGFSIYLNERLLGTYPYGNVPTYFPRFDIGGRPTATIAVIAGEDRNCAMRKILEAPECSIDTSDLWPGDTDNNGIAHFSDLLNIGLAYGATGPIRADSTLEWYAHQAPRWQRSFENGVNYKHADANGDGRIDEFDIDVIELNYNQLQSDAGLNPGIDEEVQATEGDPSIFVDLPDVGDFPSGTAFSVPIILGSENRSVESVYGIAFTIQYNTNVIDPNEVEITIPSSWIGDDDEDLLMIQRSYPSDGLIEVAISRKDQESVRGYGVIALMSGIIVDIVGFRTVEVGITKVKAIKANGEVVPIFPETRTTKITTATDDWENSKVQVYPNPVSEILYLKNLGGKFIEQIEVVNLQGKVIEQFVKPENEISVTHIPNGIYILRIQSGEEFYHQQMVKQ